MLENKRILGILIPIWSFCKCVAQLGGNIHSQWLLPAHTAYNKIQFLTIIIILYFVTQKMTNFKGETDALSFYECLKRHIRMNWCQNHLLFYTLMQQYENVFPNFIPMFTVLFTNFIYLPNIVPCTLILLLWISKARKEREREISSQKQT